jgi:hypothetical protein
MTDLPIITGSTSAAKAVAAALGAAHPMIVHGPDTVPFYVPPPQVYTCNAETAFEPYCPIDLSGWANMPGDRTVNDKAKAKARAANRAARKARKAR